MPTPLAPYINARFQILPAPTTFNPLPGLQQPGDTASGYVVDLYAKHGDRDVIEREVRGATVSTIVLNGYCVRWTEITFPNIYGGMPLIDDALASAVWDESGRFPVALQAGSDHPGCMINLDQDPPVIQEQGVFHFIRLRNPFGIGGIGEQITQEIGERFQVWYSRNA